MPATPAYRLVARAAVPLLPLVLRDDAARRAHAGRLAAPAAMARWSREARDPARPLVWVHAASVGEGLQARAVLAALAEREPTLQLVATRFSASAERLAASMPVAWTGYAPYDRPADVGAALDALRPDVLVFAKLDVWPELATGAAARGASVALVAGSVDPGSARLGWPARNLARRGYAALDGIAAIDRGDAERLVRLGADAGRIRITGDPRVDSVLEAVEVAQREPPLPLTVDPGRTLLGGSTWPADEDVLLDALVQVRSAHPAAQLVLVPHQPDAEHLARLERAATNRRLDVERWSGAASTSAVVIVDRMGVLPRLYAGAIGAMVGGGFGQRGVHSVLEPAGWERPVVIGPNDRGVRDARVLADAGALVRLTARGGAAALATIWRGWLDDPESARRAGQAGHEAVRGDRGAAARSAELVLELVRERAQRPKA